MLINYRTFITLLAGAIFKWLTAAGIIEFAATNLGGMTLTPKTIESAIITLILVIAGIFRYFAGRKIFTKKMV